MSATDAIRTSTRTANQAEGIAIPEHTETATTTTTPSRRAATRILTATSSTSTTTVRPKTEKSWRAQIGFVGGNVTQKNVGLDLVIQNHFRVGDDIYVDAGGGLDATLGFGDAQSTTPLSQSDVDIGVTERKNSDRVSVTPKARVNLTSYILKTVGIGTMLDIGYSVIWGQTIMEKRSGDRYAGSFCPEDPKKGIFGNDQGTGGCQTRPFGHFATPGTNNKTSESYLSHGLRLRFGPTAVIDISESSSIQASGGLDAFLLSSGPQDSKVGWYASLGLKSYLPDLFGSTEPAAPRPGFKPAPPAAATTPVNLNQEITVGSRDFFLRYASGGYITAPVIPAIHLTQGASGAVAGVIFDGRGQKIFWNIDDGTPPKEALTDDTRVTADITIPEVELKLLGTGPHKMKIWPEGAAQYWEVSILVEPPYKDVKVNEAPPPAYDAAARVDEM